MEGPAETKKLKREGAEVSEDLVCVCTMCCLVPLKVRAGCHTPWNYG